MSELMTTLDYILNRCSAKEIEAVEAAVKRRKKDIGTSFINPAGYAKAISSSIQKSITTSIAGLQENLKDFAWDLVLKENPDLSDEEAEQIVNSMIPNILASKQDSCAADAVRNEKSLVEDGKVNGFPKEAMLEMVFQFISYSKGTLPPEEDRALQNALGDWSQSFWKTFPAPLRDLIRSYIKGTITGEVFQEALLILLS